MINRLENIFNACSDRTRLRILALLKKRSLCVCELQAVLNLAQSTISEHLVILKKADLINSRQNGFWTDYSACSGTDCCPQLWKMIEGFLKNDRLVSRDLKKSKKINRRIICRIKRGKQKNEKK